MMPDNDPGMRTVGDDDPCDCGHKADKHVGLTGACKECDCERWEPIEDYGMRSY